MSYHIIMFLVGSTTLSFAQDWSSRMVVEQNAVYGEIGGKGIIYGVYYERLIAPTLGLSVGATYWFEFYSIPLFLTWYPVKGVHSPYLEAGVAIRGLQEYFFDNPSSHGRKYFTYKPAVFGAGYCFRSSNDGVYVRAGALLFGKERSRNRHGDDLYQLRYWFGIGYGLTF